MRKAISSARHARVARRLLLVFCATVLVPGAVLGVIGLRALTEERRAAERQVDEKLDAAAENMGRRIELKLKDWRQAADELALSGATDPAEWPARVRNLTKESGAGVVLVGDRQQPVGLPEGQLLYALSSESSFPEAWPELLNEAESIELAGKDYGRAIALYRQALQSEIPNDRAPALHGLARTQVKAGRRDDALETYRLLERTPPVRIASLPSDFLALDQIASLETEPARSADALQLYRGLVAGRWKLDRVRYASYVDQVRNWIPPTEETVRLEAEEERKMALTLAAERFVEAPHSLIVEGESTAFAFWRAEPFAAIVLGMPTIRERLMPSAEDADMQFALMAPGGAPLAGSALSGVGPEGTYMLETTEFPLRVRVQAKDPSALFAGVRRQQNLFLAMLAALVALLVFGGYFLARTLRGELALAQMKSDFVATVSHEFRAPVTGIHQLGELLLDERIQDPGERREYYALIVSEARRLRRLVDNVLDFARMEDGRKQYRFESVDPASWLRELAGDFQAEVGSRGFVVETQIPTELPAIAGDRETLTTAVHNLLDNAVKYSPDSRTVRLEASAEKECVSIAVCDRGIGIPAGERERIFERFYRAGDDLTRKVKGVGLGLNLVQHIVAAHGGAIDVDSKVGEGSRFTIRLKIERRVDLS